MAKYLITVTSSASITAFADRAPPAEYLIEQRVQASADEDDGLEHWTIDLQIAGALADWFKAPAFDAFWVYLGAVVQPLELRPRLELRVRSRFDPRTVSVVIAYLGDREVKRAAEELRKRLESVVEPKTRTLKADVSVTF